MRILHIAREARPDLEPGPIISDHMAELYEASLETISPSGSALHAAATLDDVRSEWLVPSVAGDAVGMTGRRVLQLVDDGAVEAWPVDRRTKLISLSSLRRHLRRGAA